MPGQAKQLQLKVQEMACALALAYCTEVGATDDAHDGGGTDDDGAADTPCGGGGGGARTAAGMSAAAAAAGCDLTLSGGGRRSAVPRTVVQSVELRDISVSRATGPIATAAGSVHPAQVGDWAQHVRAIPYSCVLLVSYVRVRVTPCMTM